MRKAVGVGGVFFRAKDPDALMEWYFHHLGVERSPEAEGGVPWTTDAGVTVFAPFAADSDYFPADRSFMLNFRVAELDPLLAELRSAGIEVTREETMDGVGRFARIHDPEGNPIELWEPISEEG
ncbi:MAG: VOC family protein [Pseudomonadota bacterium]